MTQFFLNQTSNRIILICCCFLILCNWGFTQAPIIDHKMNVPEFVGTAKDLIDQISRDEKIVFAYTNEVSLSYKVHFRKSQVLLKEFLETIFKDSRVGYQVNGNKIILFPEKTKYKIGQTFSLSGYVQDDKTSERLIGCVVYDSAYKAGTVTNAFGYFNLPLKSGSRAVSFRYLGYKTKNVQVVNKSDTAVVINLSATTIGLREVTVTNSLSEKNLTSTTSGVLSLNSKDIKKLPVLLGEADLMRAIQIMPGIQAANERSSGISVRGGSIDQNLFLLDDAPVFQISHAMGFYSVFNNDAVKDIKVFKGDIPANYGGRLASVVDIRLRDGNMQKYEVSGGLGMATSNLSIEGPIVKERVSFIVSGKYAYLGTLYKKINPNMSSFSFYDFNAKLNTIIDNQNRVYISSYNGGDNIQTENYRNNTFSLRWNHIYSPKLFSNVSFIYSNYNYTSRSSNDTNDSFAYSWKSGMKAYSLKADYTYFLNANNTIDFGISSTYNDFNSGKLNGNSRTIDYYNKTTPFSNRVVSSKGVLDDAMYVSNQQKLTGKLTFRYGVRASLYQNIGGHWVYNLTNYQVTDSFFAARNKVYKHYLSVEPRLGINYRLSKNSAVKASYTYITQQTQLLTRTNGGGPLDVWFPSDNNIEPQKSSQYSCGLVHYFLNNLLETRIEGYYKNMGNIIDYKDGATFLSKNSTSNINKTAYNFEEQLRVGKGYSYGTEFEVKSGFERINGFLSYTYARSMRKIAGINNGKVYPSPFDRPHTFNAFLNIKLTSRTSLGANYRQQSGQVITIPVYAATMFNKIFMGYSSRNEYRLPQYIRLDLSLTVKNKEKPGKHYHSEWNFSIINVTNHANTQYVKFAQDKDNPNIIKAEGVYILGVIPSISYHFNF